MSDGITDAYKNERKLQFNDKFVKTPRFPFRAMNPDGVECDVIGYRTDRKMWIVDYETDVINDSNIGYVDEIYPIQMAYAHPQEKTYR